MLHKIFSFWYFFRSFHVICCYLIVIVGFCDAECKREYIISGNRLKLSNQTSGKFENLTGDALDLAIVNEISEQVKIHHKVELKELMIHRIMKNVFRNFTQLTSINLQMNRISQIEDGSFKENRKLIIIDLSDNNLTKINKKTFHGKLDDLQDLKLNYNLIDSVESGSFDDCPKLEMIELSNNCLQRLGSNLFRKCPELRFARFADNIITEMAHDVFNSKTELKYLDFSSNNLVEVPQLEMKKIVEFSLSHNVIEIFNLNADNIERKKSPTINHLRLSNNLISEFVELDEHRSDIVIIDMSHNNLKEIEDLPFFLNLEVLTLSDNNITDLSLHNFGEKFPNLKILNIRNTQIDCQDFRYVRNVLTPLMVNADEQMTSNCLHSHNGSGSTFADFEDYYDPVLAKMFADSNHEVQKSLLINRAILILIFILLATFGLAGVLIAVKFRLKLVRKSNELLNNMEL